MKNFMLPAVICMVLFNASLFAQVGTAVKTQTTASKIKSGNSPDFEKYESIYKRAIGLFDYAVATDALYMMQVLKPERNDLHDSLCRVYFMRGYYYQARVLAEEILTSQNTRADIREILAQSLEELGFYTESLNEYELLYKTKPHLYLLYKIASLQFYLKRIGECELNLTKILTDPLSMKETVPISMDSKPANRQNILIAAAALNMKGVIMVEMNQPAEAKKFFEKSLEAVPDFKMARNNLNHLQASEAER